MLHVCWCWDLVLFTDPEYSFPGWQGARIGQPETEHWHSKCICFQQSMRMAFPHILHRDFVSDWQQLSTKKCCISSWFGGCHSVSNCMISHFIWHYLHFILHARSYKHLVNVRNWDVSKATFRRSSFSPVSPLTWRGVQRTSPLAGPTGDPTGGPTRGQTWSNSHTEAMTSSGFFWNTRWLPRLVQFISIWNYLAHFWLASNVKFDLASLITLDDLIVWLFAPGAHDHAPGFAGTSWGAAGSLAHRKRKLGASTQGLGGTQVSSGPWSLILIGKPGSCPEQSRLLWRSVL